MGEPLEKRTSNTMSDKAQKYNTKKTSWRARTIQRNSAKSLKRFSVEAAFC
jgi:hypothetical protein